MFIVKPIINWAHSNGVNAYNRQSHSVFDFFRHFRGRIASTARSYRKEICAKNRNYVTIEWLCYNRHSDWHKLKVCATKMSIYF